MQGAITDNGRTVALGVKIVNTPSKTTFAYVEKTPKPTLWKKHRLSRTDFLRKCLLK